MEANHLEHINNQNWTEAASALCRSAMFYETALVKCLEKHPELIEEVIAPQLETVEHCKAVLQH